MQWIFAGLAGQHPGPLLMAELPFGFGEPSPALLSGHMCRWLNPILSCEDRRLAQARPCRVFHAPGCRHWFGDGHMNQAGPRTCY